jgi:hypothetical protein
MPPKLITDYLARWGVVGRVANGVAWLAIAGGAILIVIACAVAMQWAWARHGETAVETYQQDVTQDAANRVIEATRKADEEAANAATQDEQNDKELKDAAAIGNNRTNAVLERMRQQQKAGQR